MSKEPKQIIAGMSYAWTKSFALYPASSWSLTYSIVSQNAVYEIEAVANVDDFDIEILASDSIDYAAGGFYTLFGYVDDGSGTKIPVFKNALTIFPDPTKAADMRSYAVTTLEAIEAMIAKSAGKDQQSVMVDGQTLQRRTVADLLMLRDRFQREVASEKRAADIASGLTDGPGRLQLRFK